MTTAIESHAGHNHTVRTGIEGLDRILGGGLPAHRLYLVEGEPGTGKTTMAMEFAMEGARRGEVVLYITLSETLEELRSAADSHGWSLEGITIYELLPNEELLKSEAKYTVFSPSDVELADTMREIGEIVDRTQPRRVVLDSLSEFRLLSGDPLRYRRQILALKRFFAARNCSVLLLDDLSSDSEDSHARSIAHGVLRLESRTDHYGTERRRLMVRKLRGVNFPGGYHDLRLQTGELTLFPRLVAAQHKTDLEPQVVSSGLTKLDAILGGGLPRGTSTLIIGPAGAGKSSLAGQFVCAALERNEFAATFIFEESTGAYLARSSGLGLNVKEYVDAGRLGVEQIDPTDLSPGEFSTRVRDAVEKNGAKVIVIDSVNGYMHALPNDKSLVMQIHELLMYLNQQGVITIMIASQEGMLGTSMRTPVDFSYMADNILLLRFFEAFGHVRKALSVVKKRTGRHESTIRELSMSNKGMHIGDALENFQGVLTGVPVYRGLDGSMLKNLDESEPKKRAVRARTAK